MAIRFSINGFTFGRRADPRPDPNAGQTGERLRNGLNAITDPGGLRVLDLQVQNPVDLQVTSLPLMVTLSSEAKEAHVKSLHIEAHRWVRRRSAPAQGFSQGGVVDNAMPIFDATSDNAGQGWQVHPGVPLQVSETFALQSRKPPVLHIGKKPGDPDAANEELDPAEHPFLAGLQQLAKAQNVDNARFELRLWADVESSTFDPETSVDIDVINANWRGYGF